MVLTKNLYKNDIYINKISFLLNNLKINFNCINTYLLAFVHRSLVNEKPDLSSEHNERLEFLWDAVLELIITEKLFWDFKDKPEWELTDIRSAIVKWTHLAEVAKRLNFNDYLILWKWEETCWWRNNDYLLANCLEAFLWAMYLDLDFEIVKSFVLSNIYSDVYKIISKPSLKDFKSLLQEYTQRDFNITPRYEVIWESWLDHDKNYVSGVFLDNKKIWEWTWSSKKKSQEDAAKNAFSNLYNN